MSSVNSSQELVFVAAKRTPFGSFGGSLSDLSANDLGVLSSKAAIEQSGIPASDIEASIFGNVCQTSSDAIYCARHIALKNGMSQDRPALNVNRLCGSGFEAIAQGAYNILLEGMKIVLVGGTESMTQAPYVLRKARAGYRMGHGELEDTLTASLTDSYVGLPMALTAENLAVQYKISRGEVDAFALQSQQRAAQAWKDGKYAQEISPVTLKTRKGEVIFSQDEHMKPDATLEGLGKLKPVFKADGVVTAGNASGIVDGACSLILTTAGEASARGLKVLGRLKSWAFVGCDPKIMGIGPVPATRKALDNYSKRWGKTISTNDFHLVEVNEAFAPQFLAVAKELNLSLDKTNVHGGAIAIGHPLAASGARLITHLLYSLQERGGGLGLASACIGGGQGMSMIIEV